MSTRPLHHKQFSPQEHHVRSLLYRRQMDHIQQSHIVHSIPLQGYALANLESDRCPDALQISQRLYQHNGWRLTNASDPYLSDADRYVPLYDKYFPATDYIRDVDNLEFTPLPDLAHDYFGHMPLMFHPLGAELQHMCAWIYTHGTAKHRAEIYNLARYVIEYSVVQEDGMAKIFGAGLLSSIGDFQKFMHHGFQLAPAKLETIVQTRRSPHTSHSHLFVFESFEQMYTMVADYKNHVMSTL